MICPKCKIDVTPVAMQRSLRCPQCWGVLPDCSNRTTIRKGLPDAAKKMINSGGIPIPMVTGTNKHRTTIRTKLPPVQWRRLNYTIEKEFADLMRKFDRLYDYQDPYHGWFERDSVTIIEERALVSSVVAAIIVAFFVVNEIFNFF